MKKSSLTHEHRRRANGGRDAAGETEDLAAEDGDEPVAPDDLDDADDIEDDPVDEIEDDAADDSEDDESTVSAQSSRFTRRRPKRRARRRRGAPGSGSRTGPRPVASSDAAVDFEVREIDPHRSMVASRPIASRFSAGHAMAAACGVVGFAMTFLLLRDTDATVLVAVADTDIPAGAQVTDASFSQVEVSADDPLASTALRIEGPEDAALFVQNSVTAGDPILLSDTGAAPPEPGRVELSTAVDASSLNVQVGDEVGVISVVSQGSVSTSSWIAFGVPVLSIDRESGGVLAGGQDTAVVALSVDGTQALAIGAAQAAGEVMLVRASDSIDGIALDERVLVSLDQVGRTSSAPSQPVDDAAFDEETFDEPDPIDADAADDPAPGNPVPGDDDSSTEADDAIDEGTEDAEPPQDEVDAEVDEDPAAEDPAAEDGAGEDGEES